jgi:hypothetical protein
MHKHMNLAIQSTLHLQVQTMLRMIQHNARMIIAASMHIRANMTHNASVYASAAGNG